MVLIVMINLRVLGSQAYKVVSLGNTPKSIVYYINKTAFQLIYIYSTYLKR